MCTTIATGWFEYPEVRFYALDTEGVWTRFDVITEWVDSDNTSLVLDESGQEIDMAGVGSYRQDYGFIHIDGSPAASLELPLGVEPGEEDIE